MFLSIACRNARNQTKARHSIDREGTAKSLLPMMLPLITENKIILFQLLNVEDCRHLSFFAGFFLLLCAKC